jgi:predicted transcriptional regulator
MPRKAQDVTEAELAILRVLWESGSASVRELVERLYPARTSSDLATVQKLLKRLESKLCVVRDRSVWPHLFRPGIERDELISRRLHNTAAALCDGSIVPLLTNLVRGGDISPAEIAQLRDLLESLDQAPGDNQATE